MRKGEIMSFRIGETNANYQGLLMEIVDYRRMNDIDVRFPDGTIKTTRYEHFKSGKVRCSSICPTNIMLAGRKSKRAKLKEEVADGKIRKVHMAQRYYVSRKGVVYNSKGNVLKHTVRNGYSSYRLLFDDGKYHEISGQRIVAFTWIPNPDNKPQVNHKNGIKSDNSVDNLEWVTAKENIRHRFDCLGHVGMRGELNPIAKLKNNDIRLMRKLRGQGKSLSELSAKFNLSESTVCQICKRRTWKYVI